MRRIKEVLKRLRKRKVDPKTLADENLGRTVQYGAVTLYSVLRLPIGHSQPQLSTDFTLLRCFRPPINRLAYAMAGNAVRAQSLSQDLTNASSLVACDPSPTIAQSKEHHSRPEHLQAASPIEFGQIQFVAVSCLYPTYSCGQAYLAAGEGRLAADDFQKILDHSGIVWNCWTGALAHLGVARANSLELRASQGADADAARVRALAAYKDFLTLWKDADPNIPILKQAKAEYAKLQQPRVVKLTDSTNPT